MTKLNCAAGMLALAVAMGSTSPSWAQEAAASNQSQAGDQADGEIVVTATRSETLASKTPVAISAVSGSQLTSSGITNPTALGEQVPNLSIDRANGLQITIRGVTSSDGTEKGDPSAAFMLDGIYIARPQVQEVSFFDVSRVEVLRGPQGTLFGRNTTAGLVNVISNLPKLDGVSGSFDVGYGNYNAVRATGAINLPVSTNVAVRAAINYDRRDSVLNAGPNFVTKIDPFKDNLSARLSALLDLGNGRLILRGDYTSMRGQTENILPVTNFYSNFAATGSVPNYRGAGQSADSLLTINLPYKDSLQRRNSTWGVMADFEHDLGAFQVNYLGSYRKFNRDEDGFSIRNSSLGIHNLFQGDYWQTSQELRLSTHNSGPLKAQVGAYYFKEKSGVDFYLFGFTSPTPGTTGYVRAFKQDPVSAESYAFFGQLTYNLTDTLRVTGGLRYSHDNKSRIGNNANCKTTACDLPTDVLARNNADVSFAKTNWRLGVDYDLNSRSLLYAVVSTGYKAGGFNDGCLAGTSPLCSATQTSLYYAPENITSYEAGLKTRFADNRVRLNLAAFHYDYSNLQLSKTGDFCGGTSCRVTTNAAKAKIDGVEFETTLLPVPTSKFDFAANWLNARYSDYQQTPTVSWNGYKLDRSPEWTVSAGYTQTFNLANGGNVQFSARSRLSSSSVLAALGTLNQFRIPSYSKTDVSLTYNAAGDKWYIQAFAKNLENAIVVTTVSTGSLANIQTADPRTYGVRGGFKF